LIEAAAGHTKAERRAIRSHAVPYYEAVKIAGLNDTPEEAAQRHGRPDFAYPAPITSQPHSCFECRPAPRKELDKAVVEDETAHRRKTADDPDFWSVVGQTGNCISPSPKAPS
jgi:hypothetical protein